MLQLSIKGGEMFDERTNEFVTVKPTTLQLEHSLVSLSKWESKWCIPFLTDKEKTTEETLDYIRCMTITPNVDPNVYRLITHEDMVKINSYIGAKMTATWFNDKDTGKKSREQITSELIYYSMIALNIPFECQKWHLNRLLTLIKVCNIKNDPDKHKMSKNEQLRSNAALNAARRKALGTRG